MKYQLVLQLPASSIKDYDELIQLEDTIINGLGELGSVDGHDAGCGEMNIFVLTNCPKAAFEQIERFLGTKDFMPSIKVAYRRMGSDKFTVLHPPGIMHFTLS